MSEVFHPSFTITLENGGVMTGELYPEHAPESVGNFVELANKGYYDGLTFHRVIPNFMIQGGGMTETMSEKKTGKPIKNEADNGLKNQRGTLAMARTQAVDSATSQFFINLRDNAFLDHGARDFGYAVFAKVVDGLEVMDEIAGVPTGSFGFHQDVPKEPVVITRVSVEE